MLKTKTHNHIVVSSTIADGHDGFTFTYDSDNKYVVLELSAGNTPPGMDQEMLRELISDLQAIDRTMSGDIPDQAPHPDGPAVETETETETAPCYQTLWRLMIDKANCTRQLENGGICQYLYWEDSKGRQVVHENTQRDRWYYLDAKDNEYYGVKTEREALTKYLQSLDLMPVPASISKLTKPKNCPYWPLANSPDQITEQRLIVKLYELGFHNTFDSRSCRWYKLQKFNEPVESTLYIWKEHKGWFVKTRTGAYSQKATSFINAMQILVDAQQSNT